MQRVIYLIFLWSICFSLKAEFEASIVGEPLYMPYAKKELQGHISRESHFCRGAFYPAMNHDPSCKRTAPNEETCKIKFNCRQIMPGKTRLTNMAKYPLTDTGLKSLRKMKVNIEGRSVRFEKKLEYVDGDKSNLREITDGSTVEVAKPTVEYKEEIKTESFKNFSDLEELIEEQEYGAAELEVESPLADELSMDVNAANSEEEILADELAALMEVEKDENVKEAKKPAPKPVKKQASLEKKLPKRKAKPSSKMTEASHGLFLLGLSYSFISTASSRGSVAQSADLAWSPVIKLSHNWAIRGNIGFHNIKAFISETGLEETFSAYDYGINVERSFLERAYFDVGLGIQQWQSTVGGSFSTMSLGAGYRLQDSFMWLVDQVFFNYTMVSNSDSNKEIRFGLRSYF